MIVVLHRTFEKQYIKLAPKLQSRTRERLVLFSDDAFHPLLNNHSLHGKWSGYYSINITGDIRALYYHADDDQCIFVRIDTHSNLYG